MSESNLSDKIRCDEQTGFIDGGVILTKDVREAVQKLKDRYNKLLEKITVCDDIDMLNEDLVSFNQDIREIFGPQLVGGENES